jgi:16S rRNA (guanine(966)-N(2))-methyltransferase RsmD
MRVIAGTLRSRPLAAPRGLKTRPTSDRLRETLFNVLAPRIPGAVFADLYAGSGAVAIEALSRGAAHIHLVENARPAAVCIRANLAALGITSNFTLHERSVITTLERLAQQGTAQALPQGTAFDLVFLDPPYEAEAEYSLTLHTLASGAAQLLAPNAIVIAEHAARSPLAAHYGNLRSTRTLTQGDAALSFFTISQ